MLEETQMDNLDPTLPKNKPASKRKTEPLAVYEEVLNLVRNTLKIDEQDAIVKAGYSPGVQNHWRRAGIAPLVGINALRGLLVGHQIHQAETDGKKPLLLSNDDLLTLAGEARNSKLRAAIYREVARRVDPDKS